MARSVLRARKIAGLIKHSLVDVLMRDAGDARLDKMSITSVNVTNDLGTATVLYVTLRTEDRKEIEQAIKKSNTFLRHLLAKRCNLRYVPRLFFKYDDSVERGEHISRLINSLPDTNNSEE